MPSLHNFWKLRASLRPSSGGYKADLLQAGRLKTVFEKGSSTSPRNTRPSSPLHSHSGSSSPPSSRHPSVSAFLSKLFSTSRGSTADHSPVTANPGNYAREKKALSAIAALSRVISTPSIHDPLVQSCGGYPTSLDGGVHVTVSTTTSRLPQESWREHLNCEKSICKDHAICTAAEETQEEWKEQRLGPRENVTGLDASSKLSIISFETKKELRILHSAKISNIVDGFNVRSKISGEGERLETGRYLMEFWHIIPSNLLFPAMVSWLSISSYSYDIVVAAPAVYIPRSSQREFSCSLTINCQLLLYIDCLLWTFFSE